VFLCTYYTDVTLVTGKNMLFLKKQRHLLDVKAKHAILNISRNNLNSNENQSTQLNSTANCTEKKEKQLKKRNEKQ
jgi:hypothetical protein